MGGSLQTGWHQSGNKMMPCYVQPDSGKTCNFGNHTKTREEGNAIIAAKLAEKHPPVTTIRRNSSPASAGMSPADLARRAAANGGSPVPRPPMSRPAAAVFAAVVSTQINPPKRRPREADKHFYVYHKDIGFPRGYDKQLHALRNAKVDLQWSRHAQDEADADRYGQIELMDKMDASQGFELIELKFNQASRKVSRALYRSQPDHNGNSTCLVLAIDPRGGNKWNVVTSWINEANDRHTTLRRERYDFPHDK